MDSPATTEALAEAMWSGFKAADNCYADESMDVIDTGGNYESFSMSQVAAHVLQALEAAGFSVVAAPPLVTGRELRDCSVDGCGGPGGRRVTTDHPLCEKHYQQWRRGQITDEGTSHG